MVLYSNYAFIQNYAIYAVLQSSFFTSLLLLKLLLSLSSVRYRPSLAVITEEAPYSRSSWGSRAGCDSDGRPGPDPAWSETDPAWSDTGPGWSDPGVTSGDPGGIPGPTSDAPTADSRRLSGGCSDIVTVCWGCW